ncbi:restriction endonuclease [Rippkaea orientalis PCC 8801]|uniref:Restriction endonuclease n=2 Tax=Rippkaea TaxID=2546365 RepID=B7K0Z5_RIPO1|nr:restriction endonuclease [Rippkaea orientalis PCC 8801]
MSIPDFQSILLPLLKYSGDKQEHSLRESIEYLAGIFNLTDEEKRELLPSGQQAIFDNRVGWAKTYLKKAHLIETTKRGYFRITDQGITVLQQNYQKIDTNFLKQFEEFNEFHLGTKTKKDSTNNSENSELSCLSLNDQIQTPEELLDQLYQKIKDDLKQEILEQIMRCSPEFFERLVIDLLIKMGYGGSKKEAGKAVGKAKDGGIDGIIKEDRLGLDIIYIQAKRWEGTVGRPEIQKFVGALLGQQAKKGIFITTSQFSKEAKEYVAIIDSKIILISGDLLSELLSDYNVGVSVIKSYEIKKIDTDYFTE